jgi:hypothetical protein
MNSAWIALVALLLAVASFNAYVLGEKSAAYSCSPASIEHAMIRGGELVYAELERNGRLKDD